MEKIKSTLWTLNSNDWVKIVKTAVITAFVGALYAAFQTFGIDVTAYDWKMIVEISITAGVARLFEKLMSDENGKLLGKF